ncbi:unnamed protein product [Ectocarpus sp. CCAP 1310/34]|nr:unnamed protein product [Ectocarpus sp. CCAP 1310/34]
MSSPARMAADPAAATTIAAGADYAVVQDPVLVQRGDSRVMDIDRVGVFPGPRSCADTINLFVWIAVVQPLVDAHDYKPKPIFLDLICAPPAAQPVVPSAPQPAPGAHAFPPAPAAGAATAAATLSVGTATTATSGPVVAPGSHPEDEDSATKRARTDGAEGAAGSSVAGEPSKRIAVGDSPGGDRPLLKVLVQAQGGAFGAS